MLHHRRFPAPFLAAIRAGPGALLLVPLACGHRAESSAPAPPAAASAPDTVSALAPGLASAPTPDSSREREDLAVVWTRKPPGKRRRGSAGGADVSHFLAADGHEVAARPGIYLAAGDSLLRWQSTTRVAPSERCPSPQENAFPRRTLRDGALVPVGAGTRVVVRDFTAPRREVGGEVEDQEPIPVAVIGNTLFVRTRSSFFGCGAHPVFEDELRIFRVGPDGGSAQLTVDDLRDGTDARRADAAREINRGGAAAGSPVRGEALTLTMVYPAFDGRGVRWVAQFTAPASWAQSDGRWSGYTVSAIVDLPATPARLAAVAVPRAVIEYAAAHPDEEVRGVSSGKLDVPP